MAKVVWSDKKKLKDSGVLKVTTENPEFVERGHAGRFQVIFEHVNDGLIDPTTPTLKTYEGSTLKDTLTPTKDSTGIYYFDYSIPATAGTGPWIAEWSGTYVGLTILVRATFEVVRSVES